MQGDSKSNSVKIEFTVPGLSDVARETMDRVNKTGFLQDDSDDSEKIAKEAERIAGIEDYQKRRDEVFRVLVLLFHATADSAILAHNLQKLEDGYKSFEKQFSTVQHAVSTVVLKHQVENPGRN